MAENNPLEQNIVEAPKQKVDFLGLLDKGFTYDDIINNISSDQEVVFPEEQRIQSRFADRLKDPRQYNDFLGKAQKAFNDYKKYEYALKSSMNPGIAYGHGLMGDDIKMFTDQQIAESSGFYKDKKGEIQPLSGKGVFDMLTLEMDESGQPYYQERDYTEDLRDKQVVSWLGPSELYSSWYSKALNGILHNSLGNVPSILGNVVNTVEDLSSGLANGIINGKWESVPNMPWHHGGNFLQNISNGLDYKAEDYNSSLTYGVASGIGSMLQATLTGFGTGSLLKTLGTSGVVAGNVANKAALGIGSAAMMDAFSREAKQLGISDFDAAALSIPIGAITWATEAVLGPKAVFDFYRKYAGQETASKILRKEVQDELVALGLTEAKQLPKGAIGRIAQRANSLVFSKIKSLKDNGVIGTGIQSAIEEGTEELVEGRLHNIVRSAYDQVKIYTGSPEFDERGKKSPGLFGVDFTPEGIMAGAGDDFVIGALAGGIGGAAAHAGGRLYQNRNGILNDTRTNDVTNLMSSYVSQGKEKELRDIINKMSDKGRLGFRHTDGVDILVNNDERKSINDVNRDALLQQLDLVKEVYDKSGINNPLFIKESLG